MYKTIHKKWLIGLIRISSYRLVPAILRERLCLLNVSHLHQLCHGPVMSPDGRFVRLVVSPKPWSAKLTNHPLRSLRRYRHS